MSCIDMGTLSYVQGSGENRVNEKEKKASGERGSRLSGQKPLCIDSSPRQIVESVDPGSPD